MRSLIPAGPRPFKPAYLATYDSGELFAKTREALDSLQSCSLCPRRCEVNRLQGQRGFCRTGRLAVVASFGPHFGEERPLVGQGGSGTIFFTHCNLKCCFCQNYDISNQGAGDEMDAAELARLMVQLQKRGCHNINFVTPSHVVAQILEALPLAIERGLRVPLIYNSGGYDLDRTIKLLEGVMDIYMPDFKFTCSEMAGDLAGAGDYPDAARTALVEMHRQVGDLVLDSSGLAVRGLLIRHLVLPGGLAGTEACLRWIAEHLSRHTYVNVMDQYRPCGTVPRTGPLSRRITEAEYLCALELADQLGFDRVDSNTFNRALDH